LGEPCRGDVQGRACGIVSNGIWRVLDIQDIDHWKLKSMVKLADPGLPWNGH